MKTRNKIILIVFVACIATLFSVAVYSAKRIGLIHFYHRTTSSPESRASLSIVPHGVVINDYPQETAESIDLPFASFQLPKVDDSKLSTTENGAVLISNHRFSIVMLPVSQIPQTLDELIEKKKKQNEEMIKLITALNKSKVKLSNPVLGKIDRSLLEKDVARFGMPESYEREMLTQMTLPKPIFKLTFMPFADLERYVALAFEKASLMKKDVGFFQSANVKGVIRFKISDQDKMHVIAWSLDHPVGQGIYYTPKDMKDLDPLKMMLNTLIYRPVSLETRSPSDERM